MIRPDFRQPIEGDGFRIYFPFEGEGAYGLTPDRLQIAMRPGVVQPGVRLQLYRGQNPMLPPQPYGILEMRLELRYPLESALTRLRELHPGARLEPAAFTAGYLRLNAPDGVELPEEIREPVRLSTSGLSNALYVLRLSLDGAQMVKGMLRNDTVPVFAQAEFELAGMAPRLPLRVRFDPARFRPALLALADESGRVARNRLANLFAVDPASLGLELEGETVEPQELAETLTDWIRARFGAFSAAPQADGQGYMSLSLPDWGAGRAEWDLSQPLQTWRPIILQARPFDTIREAVHSAGMDAIVPPPVIVPPLSTGMHQIEISTNIPGGCPGVAALGVTLRAGPQPPKRPQAVVSSVELATPAETALIRLQLSPNEPLAYTYSTFLIMEDSRGIRQFDGPETPGSGNRLMLTPDDFPVRLIPLSVDRGLVGLAAVHGRCRWLEEEAAFTLDFDFGTDGLERAIPFPAQASEAEIAFEMRARDNDRLLSIGPFPATPMHLGFHLFPEYGPHQVSIELAETSASSSSALPLVAVDLLPEDRPEASEAITVVALTPAQPRKTWSYFAASPFRPGFRFRRHADEAAGIPGPWSDVRSPFDKLIIDPERM